MTAGHLLTILGLLGWLIGTAAPMNFTTLARGDHSLIENPRQVVVRTPAEWSALWKEHAGGGKAPSVDFTRSTVIAVFAGSRPTAGYGVQITRIERQSGGAMVTYGEQAPAPDAMVAQVLTSPFHIVRTERVAGPVKFITGSTASDRTP